MITQLKTLTLSYIKGKYFISWVSGLQVLVFAKHQAEFPRESGTPFGHAVIQPPVWPISVYQRASYSGNGSANEWQPVGRVKHWNSQERGDSNCRLYWLRWCWGEQMKSLQVALIRSRPWCSGIPTASVAWCVRWEFTMSALVRYHTMQEGSSSASHLCWSTHKTAEEK